MQDLCPCHSQKKYASCCKKYHQGILPVNALELMRSRYAAYALNMPFYIIQTTHKDHFEFENDLKKWKKAIESFSKNTQFIDLKILAFEEEGTSAFVTFFAKLTQQGKEASFTEKSTFIKEGGKWLYLKGEIS